MKFRKLKSLKFLYEINENGVLRNCKSKKIINGYQEKNGYIRVKIENKCLGIVRTTVHRLVAEAFIPNTDNKEEVNHINSIRNDNRISNLEWVTHSENMKHSYKKGLTTPPLNAKRIKVIEDDKIYNSVTEYATFLFEKGKGKNIESNISYISSVLRGNRKTVYGKKVIYY